MRTADESRARTRIDYPEPDPKRTELKIDVGEVNR
jgi:hypothetical protein